MVHAEPPPPTGPPPLHIDVHDIPAKGEPAHRHYDFRYLFRTDTAEVTALQVEEVTGCAWRPAVTITAEPLRSRPAGVVSSGAGRGSATRR